MAATRLLSSPPLQKEPTGTSGTAKTAFNLDDVADDGNVNLNAMHYVTTATTVGGAGTTIDLLPGDLLFATDDDEDWNNTIGGDTSADKEDIVLFRPDEAGDYSAGQFTILLDNPTGNKFHAFTLAETDIITQARNVS